MSETEVQLKIQEQLSIIYFALIWSLLALFWAWSREIFKPFVMEKKSPVTVLEVVIGFGLFISISLILIPALFTSIYFLLTGTEIDLSDSAIQFWYTICSGACCLITLLLFSKYFLSVEQKKSIFGDSSVNRFQSFFWGASTWLVIFPLILFLNQLLDMIVLFYTHQANSEQIPVELFRAVQSNPLRAILMTSVIVVIAPFTEEFLFRGLLQSLIKKKLNSPVWGILIAALIFALFHFSGSYGLTNIQFIFSIFILGCFLGFLYEKQKTIWASIGLHSLFNAMTVLSLVLEK